MPLKLTISQQPNGVLFSGSGTTGVVSVRNKRKYIGIEIDLEYLEISKKRILDEVGNR
jgi:DNA modification methylase